VFGEDGSNKIQKCNLTGGPILEGCGNRQEEYDIGFITEGTLRFRGSDYRRRIG
jgi:hypothetical protein